MESTKIKEVLFSLLPSKKIAIWIVGIGILISLIIFGFQPSKDYVTKMIRTTVQQQTSLILANYEKQFERTEAQIDELKKQNVRRDEKIAAINKKIGGIENEISTNALPRTSEELRNRFHKLGFDPIN